MASVPEWRLKTEGQGAESYSGWQNLLQLVQVHVMQMAFV
jgi:hypothetical protein